MPQPGIKKDSGMLQSPKRSYIIPTINEFLDLCPEGPRGLDLVEEGEDPPRANKKHDKEGYYKRKGYGPYPACSIQETDDQSHDYSKQSHKDKGKLGECKLWKPDSDYVGDKREDNPRQGKDRTHDINRYIKPWHILSKTTKEGTEIKSQKDAPRGDYGKDIKLAFAPRKGEKHNIGGNPGK